MKNRILTFLFLIVSTFSFSQINELGISVGGSNYIGDVGAESYIAPNDLYYGLIYKWNMTPRIAFRAQASYIKIQADDAESDNAIKRTRGFSFKNAVKEFGVGIEFNYYNYSMREQGWGSTPYLILEVAAINYNVVVKETTPNNFVTQGKMGFTIPVGIGYKTTIGNNIGFGFESKLRYTFADDLDYNNLNYTPLSFGNPDTNDWYVTVGINFVVGFGRKGCYSETF